MQSCVVENVVKVTNGNNKKYPWFPKVRVVNEVPFIQILRFCRDLTRFCTGRAMDLRKGKGHVLKGAWIEKMYRLRNEASHSAFAETTRDPDKPHRKRQRKAKKSDSLLAPSWVDMTFPRTTSFAEAQVKCLWGVGKAPLWIELRGEALDHLKECILEFSDEGSSSKKKSGSKKDH